MSNTTVKSLIESTIASKTFVKWGEALTIVCPGKTYRPSDTGTIIKAFEEELAGSSALLVNADGEYSVKAPAEAHKAFLKGLGYTVVPGVATPKVKKAKATGGLTGMSVEDLMQAISLLKAMEATKKVA